MLTTLAFHPPVWWFQVMWSGISQDCDPSPGHGGFPSVLCLGHRGLFLLLRLYQIWGPSSLPSLGHGGCSSLLCHRHGGHFSLSLFRLGGCSSLTPSSTEAAPRPLPYIDQQDCSLIFHLGRLSLIHLAMEAILLSFLFHHGCCFSLTCLGHKTTPHSLILATVAHLCPWYWLRGPSQLHHNHSSHSPSSPGFICSTLVLNCWLASPPAPPWFPAQSAILLFQGDLCDLHQTWPTC